MVEMILGKFTDITLKCIERNAEDFSVDKKDVRLVFRLNKDDEVEYWITKFYKPEKKLSFLGVLGVKLDFKGYSLFVPKFIQGALTRFCVEDNIERKNVYVVLSNVDDKLVMGLQDGRKEIRKIDLKSLFNADDMIT
jgi:hypothetical protein